MSYDWRADAPQEICALQKNPCTMFNLPASSFATFSNASRILSKAHSVALISTLKMILYSSQPPPFNAKYPCFIILGVQSVSTLLFTCSNYSLARDSRCYWPCVSSCFSFSASFRNFFDFTLTGLFLAFSIACHDALSFPQLPSTAILQRRQALSRQAFVGTLLAQIDCVDLLTILDHSRSKLPESDGFVTAAIVTPKHRPSRNADRAWHEAQFFCCCFLQAQVQ